MDFLDQFLINMGYSANQDLNLISTMLCLGALLALFSAIPIFHKEFDRTWRQHILFSGCVVLFNLLFLGIVFFAGKMGYVSLQEVSTPIIQSWVVLALFVSVLFILGGVVVGFFWLMTLPFRKKGWI